MVIEPLFEKATVKETVAFSRFSSVFGTDRPASAPTVPRNVPKGLCPERTTQSTRVVAFTVGGDGLDVGGLHLAIEGLGVNALVTYTEVRGEVAEWPKAAVC